MYSKNFKELFETKYLDKQQKITLSQLPVISTALMTGQLILNKHAIQLLNAKVGELVYLIDIGNEETPVNERFFITNGFMMDDKWFGSKIHESGKINHSIMYNSILSKGAVTVIGNRMMVRRGYFTSAGAEKYKAKYKVRMILEPYYEESEAGRIDKFAPAPGVSPQAFYRLNEWHIVVGQ